MPRKLFISILGTGYYENTKYYFGNKENYFESRFIQEASMLHFLKDWTERDVACILLTTNSEKTNWNSPAHENNKFGKTPYSGLQETLLRHNFNCKIINKHIPDGNNEAEIWEIFEIVFNLIEEEDEIYFDITHAFRSIPMLVMVLINYAKFLKNISVKMISYGNYEGRDDQNLSPIIDLTAFSKLQDWTSAANVFTKTGQLKAVNELLGNIESLPKFNFSDFINNSRGLDLYKGKEIIDYKSKLKKLNSPAKPFDGIKTKILSKVSSYKQNSALNGFIAVGFCIENGLSQQGITLLQEFVVTKVMTDLQMSFAQIKSYNFRNIIDVALKFEDKNTIETSRLTSINENANKSIQPIIDKVFELEYKAELTKVFKEFSGDIRNDVNHAGFRENCNNPKEIENFLSEYYKKFSKILNLNQNA